MPVLMPPPLVIFCSSAVQVILAFGQPTWAAMGCGMGPAIAAQVRDRLLDVPGVEEADVQIVWDPPWNQSMITDDGKKRLRLW